MKLGIRLQLFAGFGVVLLILVIVGVIGYVKLNEADVAIDSIGKGEVPAIQSVYEVEAAALTIRRDVRQAIIVTSEADRKKATDDLNLQVKSITVQMSILDKLQVTTDGKAQLAALKAAYTPWVAEQQQIATLASAGKDAEATTILLSASGTKMREAIDAALKDLIDGKMQRVDATVKTAQDSSTQAIMLMIGAVVVGVIAGLGIAFVVSQKLAGSANQLAAAAAGLAAGNVNQQLTVKSNDEMGELARSFEAMIGTLRALVAETMRLVEAAKAGRLSERGDEAKFQGAYADL
ncbi:MAG: MCP four helix bundle domain-containing protein, partial [Chloroflexi bacterium]|nr:MCP four helix bundle domain-containing protein [Chloroflexota bacterium]